MLVRHRMTPNPMTIGPHAMLSEAQEKMTAGHFRRLPVMDDGALVGILNRPRYSAALGLRSTHQSSSRHDGDPVNYCAGYGC